MRESFMSPFPRRWCRVQKRQRRGGCGPGIWRWPRRRPARARLSQREESERAAGRGVPGGQMDKGTPYRLDWPSGR